MISSLVWDVDIGGARKRAHFLQHFCSLSELVSFSIIPPSVYTLEECPSKYASSQKRLKQLHQLYELKPHLGHGVDELEHYTCSLSHSTGGKFLF